MTINTKYAVKVNADDIAEIERQLATYGAHEVGALVASLLRYKAWLMFGVPPEDQPPVGFAYVCDPREHELTEREKQYALELQDAMDSDE